MFTEEEYKNAKNDELLNLQCDICKTIYKKTKKLVYSGRHKKVKRHICSKNCLSASIFTSVKVSCLNCGKEFFKNLSQLKKRKNSFCCCSCAAIYNNKNCTRKKYVCEKCGDDIFLYPKSAKNKTCAKCAQIIQKKKIRIRKNKDKYSEGGKCRICGSAYINNNKTCKREDICNKDKLFKGLSKYFGFNLLLVGSEEIYKEFDRIKNLIINDYWNKKLSLIEMAKKYKHNNVGNFSKLLSSLNIKFRNLSESSINSLLNNNRKMPNNYKYKTGYHTTWNNKKIYYRSSYELEYAKYLDEQKIEYKMENLRIPYWDSVKNRQRIAIPDFYLPKYNKIIEIKSDYTFDKQNMIDKFQSYRQKGYECSLILEKKIIDM